MQHVGNVPFNLLMVPHCSENGSINWSGDRETHLPGYAATSKANTALFPQATTPVGEAINHRKLPFALHMPEKFEYSLKRQSILSAYPHFAD